MTTANREFKSSMFSHYFSDKERIIDAYNAIAGTSYPLASRVEFKTLQNVLYRSQINDVSFMLEDHLIVLMEHQSTINENMPLRLLLYIGEIYKGYVPGELLYRKAVQNLPTPEFIVVYNGVDPHPPKKILRISDAFINPPAGPPSLELTVPVYNIAKGHNKELLKQSVALSDYAIFVDSVREGIDNGDELETAIEKTIHYCLENGIMVAYLNEYSAEVRKMLSLEWNDEIYRKVLLEEGREEGFMETARRLKAEGVEKALIIKVSGLTEQEVDAL